MLTCEICKRSFTQITNTHLATHNMTTAEYRSKFPDSPLQDESIIMRGADNPFFGKHHSNEVKQLLHEKFTGKSVDEETKKKISEGLKKAWSDPNCSFRTEDYRNLLSQITQGHWDSDKSIEHREINRQVFTRLRPTYNEKLEKVRASDLYRENMKNALLDYWSKQSSEEKYRRVKKALETLTKSGTMASKAENQLYDDLREKFGDDDIHRHVWIRSPSGRMWNFDFYIKSIDTYVQFDGVYWHGLDRPLELVKESTSAHGKMIYKKWLTDREQDEWALESNAHLIRITDVEYKEDPQTCLSRIK